MTNLQSLDSRTLISDYYKEIKKWWDVKTFNWNDPIAVRELLYIASRTYHVWGKDKSWIKYFPWEDNNLVRLLFMTIEIPFEDIWYPDKIKFTNNLITVLLSKRNSHFETFYPYIKDVLLGDDLYKHNINILLQHCNKVADMWIDDFVERINNYDAEISYSLSFYENHVFYKWWDPDKFDWTCQKCVNNLFTECIDYFKIWWDPSKIDIKTNSQNIVKLAASEFPIWWDRCKDELTFNADNLISLIIYNIKYIKKWYNYIDAKLYADESIILYFLKNGKQYTDIWWDDILPHLKQILISDHQIKLSIAYELLDYGNFIEDWWVSDADVFWDISSQLATELHDYFDIWWDSNKFDYVSGLTALIEYCTTSKKQFKKWWNPKLCWILLETPYDKWSRNDLFKKAYKYIKIWNPKV